MRQQLLLERLAALEKALEGAERVENGHLLLQDEKEPGGKEVVKQSEAIGRNRKVRRGTMAILTWRDQGRGPRVGRGCHGSDGEEGGGEGRAW